MAASLNNRSQYLLVLNSLMSNHTNEVSTLLQKKHDTVHHLTHSTKTRNYCYYVGRARAVTKGLFITRHTLHKFVRFGMLPGFIKARQ
jgi:ribosomal protein S14